MCKTFCNLGQEKKEEEQNFVAVLHSLIEADNTRELVLYGVGTLVNIT